MADRRDAVVLVHRSLSRWDSPRHLMLKCARKPLLDTWFFGVCIMGVLLVTVSFIPALVVFGICVRRTMILLDLGRIPYGYDLHQRMMKSTPVLRRGARAFARPLGAHDR